MIAACPQCQTRFRLAREKLGPQGARVRCSRCQTIFHVQPPDDASASTPAESPPPAPAKTLSPLARAVIAETDPELSKGIADLLAQWRISFEIVEDGGDALLEILRSPPQLAILGAGLASLSAAKLGEIVRRMPQLVGVKLVQVAVAAEPPSSSYQADAMIEPADLPAGLGAILGRLGIGANPVSAPAQPESACVPAPDAAPAAAPNAIAPARPARPTLSSDPEIAAAERLARIAVSDVILYNEAKFAAAIAAGNVDTALAVELEEARQHFNSRVSPIVRQNRDFLKEELERRTAARKA